MLKVIIAEDQSIFAEGLKQTLRKSSDEEIHILSLVTNGTNLEEEVRHHRPDILFLDLSLPGCDSLSMLKPIHNIAPDMRIIVFTIYQDTKMVREAFRNGADGYILKTCKPCEIHEGIREVKAGKVYMGSGVSATERHIAVKQNDTSNKDWFMQQYCLTNREMEILRLLSNALTNKQISEELYISDQTVGVHRKNIMRKLGVSNSAALVRMLHHNNMLV